MRTGVGCLTVLVLVVLAAILSDNPQSSSTGDPERAVAGLTARWVWNTANVRQKSSASAAVVRSLEPGAKLLVKDSLNGWWSAYDTAGTQLGFIANSVLRAEALPDKVSTYTMAQHFVKENLRAPRTAKFPWGSSEHIVEHLGDGRFRIYSYVDAQNAFGALIRNKYWVILSFVGAERWRLEDIRLE